MKNVAFETFYTYSPTKNEDYNRIINSLKSLSEDQNIVIINPDKGNGVVILDKANYHSKIHSILQDSSKFVIVHEDWFKSIIKNEDHVNRFLSYLLQEKSIDKATYDYLRVSSSKPGVLFGLPKVYKKEFHFFPFCPPL